MLEQREEHQSPIRSNPYFGVASRSVQRGGQVIFVLRCLCGWIAFVCELYLSTIWSPREVLGRTSGSRCAMPQSYRDRLRNSHCQNIPTGNNHTSEGVLPPE